MNSRIVGESHSLKRYVAFGLIAGVVSGTLAAVFDLSLPIVTTVATVVAAWSAGIGRGPSIPTPA